MSKLYLYDNNCLYCDTPNPCAYPIEYCDDNCERKDKYRYRNKVEDKIEMLLNRIEELEERISDLENTVNN